MFFLQLSMNLHIFHVFVFTIPHEYPYCPRFHSSPWISLLSMFLQFVSMNIPISHVLYNSPLISLFYVFLPFSIDIPIFYIFTILH